jgi:hypothetical protein
MGSASEMSILLGADEEKALLSAWFAAGAWLVPDLNYPGPQVQEINSYEDYGRHRKSTRLFFVQHRSFIREPLEMYDIEKNGQRGYFIRQKNGGPTIEFLSSVEYVDAGLVTIGAGFISHYAQFWSARSKQMQEVPQELVVFFAEMRKSVRAVAKKEKIGLRAYWVGHSVVARVEAGTLRIGIARSRK